MGITVEDVGMVLLLAAAIGLLVGWANRNAWDKQVLRDGERPIDLIGRNLR